MIEVVDLCKTYTSGRGKVSALDGITFEVEKGETFIIAGISGSGKTTLLNCIGGLEKPTRGMIKCAGIDINRLSRRALSLFQRERIGFVFQSGNLLSHLTIAENLEIPLALNGSNSRLRKKRIEELLEMIGLPPALGSALPRELSGGETQRVALARAIAHAPQILLADEPTANLDSVTGRGIIQLMVSLSRRDRCTLVVASHDPEVIRAGNHRFRLKDGRKETSP